VIEQILRLDESICVTLTSLEREWIDELSLMLLVLVFSRFDHE